MARKQQLPILQWRDELKELLTNRTTVVGLRQHPMYSGITLDHIDRLNQLFRAGFDFREYLAIHAMFSRLLDRDPDFGDAVARRWDLRSVSLRLLWRLDSNC